jgi:hypothetical protein
LKQSYDELASGFCGWASAALSLNSLFLDAIDFGDQMLRLSRSLFLWARTPSCRWYC